MSLPIFCAFKMVTCYEISFTAAKEEYYLPILIYSRNIITMAFNQNNILMVGKAFSFTSSLTLGMPPEGLDHCSSAPVSTRRNSLVDEEEIRFSRSLTDRTKIPRPELKLDRLSESEKVRDYVYERNLCGCFRI